jgi:hypothetical protein
MRRKYIFFYMGETARMVDDVLYRAIDIYIPEGNKELKRHRIRNFTFL